MPKFEYRTLISREIYSSEDWYLDAELIGRNVELVKALNILGEDGWEVAIQKGSSSYLMKRAIEEEEEEEEEEEVSEMNNHVISFLQSQGFIQLYVPNASHAIVEMEDGFYRVDNDGVKKLDWCGEKGQQRFIEYVGDCQ